LDDLPFDYAIKLSRIVHPKWATDMYTIYGQHKKVERYLKSHFMDGYIKKKKASPLDTFNSTRCCSTRQTKIAPTKKTTCHTLTPSHKISGATQNLALFFLVSRQIKQFIDIITMNTVHRTKFEHAYILDVHFSKSTIDLNVTAASIIPDSHRNLNSVRHAQLTGHTVILEAQAGLLRYGDPELFVPFLKDKSTDLWLLPLLPPPQAHNGVYPIYNAEPSSEHAQRNDYKDSDQGIVHGSTDLPFSMVSDNSQPTSTICASTSATFNQDRTELLNNHHCLGHIIIKRAQSLNIDGIPQPPPKMPKVKCPVCIASKATRHKRPSATTADTRSASGP